MCCAQQLPVSSRWIFACKRKVKLKETRQTEAILGELCCFALYYGYMITTKSLALMLLPQQMTADEIALSTTEDMHHLAISSLLKDLSFLK